MFTTTINLTLVVIEHLLNGVNCCFHHWHIVVVYMTNQFHFLVAWKLQLNDKLFIQ